MDLSQEKPPKRNPFKRSRGSEKAGQNGTAKEEKNTVKISNETTPKPSRKAMKHPAISYKLSSSETDSDDDAFVKPPPRKRRAVPAEKRAGPSSKKSKSELEVEVPRRKKKFPILRERGSSPTVPEERKRHCLKDKLEVVGSVRRDPPNNPGNSSSVSGQQPSTSRVISGNIQNPLKRLGETVKRGQDGNGKPTCTAHNGREATAKAFGGFLDYITSLNIPQKPSVSETRAMAGVEMEDNSTPQPVGTSGGGEEAFAEGQGTMPQNSQPIQQQEQGGDAGTGAMDKRKSKMNEDGLNTEDSEEHLVPTSRRRRRIVSINADSDDETFAKTPPRRAVPSNPPSASSEHSGEDVVTTRQRSRKSVVVPSFFESTDSSDSSQSTQSSFLEDSDSTEETEDDDFISPPPRTRKAVAARKRSDPVPKQVAGKRVLFPNGKEKKSTTGEAGLNSRDNEDISVSRPTGRGVEEEFEEIDNNVAGDQQKSKIIVPSTKGVKVELDTADLHPHYRLLLEIEKRTSPLSEEGLKEFEESCKSTGMNPNRLWWKTIKARKPNPARQMYVLKLGEKGSHQLITTYVNIAIAQNMTGAYQARNKMFMEDPEAKKRIYEQKQIHRAQEDVKFHAALRVQEILTPVVYQLICIKEDEILGMSPSDVLERIKAGLIPNIKYYTGEWGCIHKPICYRRTHSTEPASTVRIAANDGHRAFQLGVWSFSTKAKAEEMESLLMINETAHSEKAKKTEILNRVPGVPISAALITSAITLGRQGVRMISFTNPIPDEERADPYQLRYPMQDSQFIEITDTLRKHQLEIPMPSLTSSNDESHVYVVVCIKQEDFPNNVSTAKFQDLLKAGLEIPLYVYAGYTTGKHRKGLRLTHFTDRNGTLFKFAAEGGRVFSVAEFPCSSIQQGTTMEVAVITVIQCYAENHPNIFSMNKKWGDSRTIIPTTDTFLEAATIGSTGPALLEWSSKFTLSYTLQLPWKAQLVDITDSFKCVK